MTVENPHLDDGALNARRYPQRGIANVGGFFAEDGTQEFLLERHRAFTLLRYLTDQDVACMNLGTDVYDAGFIEVLHLLFPDIGNVASDLLGTHLGVPRHHP